MHTDPGDLIHTPELGLPSAVVQRRGRSFGTAAAARRLRPRSSRGRCGGGERGPPPCRGLLARPPCAGAGAGAERAGGIPPPPRPGPREIQPPWLGRLRLPRPRPLSTSSGLRSRRGPSAGGSAVPGLGARIRARSRSAPGPGRRHHVTPARARPGQVSSREEWGSGRACRALCSAPQAGSGCSPGAAHARGSRGLGPGPELGGRGWASAVAPGLTLGLEAGMTDPRDGLRTTRSAEALFWLGLREAGQRPPSFCPAGMEA